jgi:hypothetical protein
MDHFDLFSNGVTALLNAAGKVNLPRQIRQNEQLANNIRPFAVYA